MLELYYRPMACSLASRIALEEAGLDAAYHRVDLHTKQLTDGSDFRAVAPRGQVPVLRTDDGAVLLEGAAVLQYIADRRPESGLAPAPGDPLRYELQTWLHFIGTELHKAFLFPWFLDGTPEPVRVHGRARFDAMLPFVADHLAERSYLVGDAFSVADAYLVWVLVLARFAGVELPASLAEYLARQESRPGVARALAHERAEIQAELAAATGDGR